LPDIFDALIYAADLDDADLSGYEWFDEVFPAGLSAIRPRPSGGAADVINMSLGAPMGPGGGQDIYLDLLEAVRANGCVVIAAAGNSDIATSGMTGDWSMTNEYLLADFGAEGLANQVALDYVYRVLPADSSDVICVGAVGYLKTKASYSSFGAAVDLVAPGGDGAVHPYAQVFSTDSSSDGYAFTQGTSMAAPHVAGVVSLMLAANPLLTPDEVEATLEASCIDLGYPLVYGAGFLRADIAVAAAAASVPAPQLLAGLSQISIQRDQTTAEFLIANSVGDLSDLGPYTYSVDPDPGSEWIASVALADSGGQIGTITVTVDRGVLSDGTYMSDLTIHSTSGGSVTVEVVMEVQATLPAPSFDTIYVLLLDPYTYEVIDQDIVTLPDQRFRFDDVPTGVYFIAAGTDLDDDGFIDDDGEWFGDFGFGVDNPLFFHDGELDLSEIPVELFLVQQPAG